MKYIAIAILIITTFTCNAETLWSDFSATILKGSDYEVGDDTRTVFTFEHTAGYNWGDSFIFIDRLHSKNGDRETYAEFSPRFQISTYNNDVIENIYIATTAEVGEDFTHYLIGLGTKLKIPHFNYFSMNLYKRNNDFGDNGQQVTLSWSVPIWPLTYDGFIDYVPSNDNNSTSTNFTSQLKYNVANVLNMKTKLYVGIEYVYWKNKFGIDGVDEKNMNLLIKYHF
jgi:nucleoside-specific outer membrane channel protein Tsx